MKDTVLNFGLLWLRVLMGAGIAYHGYGKIFDGQLPMLTSGLTKMGFTQPEIFAWAAALAEFVGGILIAIGLFTRTAALAVFCTMSVAAFIAHGKDPLQTKELALAYWTVAGSLIFTGAGGISLDKIFFKKK